MKKTTLKYGMLILIGILMFSISVFNSVKAGKNSDDMLTISGNPKEIADLYKLLSEDNSFGYSGRIIQNYIPAISDGTVATSSNFIGDVSPNITDQFNLGSPTYSWRNIYASGTITSTSGADFPFLRINADTTNTSGTLYLDNHGSIYASSSLFIVGNSNGAIVDDINNLSTGGSAYSGTIFRTDGGVTYLYRTSAGYTTDAAMADDFLIQDTGGGDIVLYSGVELLRASNGNSSVMLNRSTANASGTLYFDNDGSIYTSGTIYIGLGSVSAPSLAFRDETNTGFYRLSTGRMMVTTGGVNTFLFDDVGNYTYATILPNSNNTRDLGAYAVAFKDIYASGTLYIGNNALSATSTILTGDFEMTQNAATTTLHIGDASAAISQGACIAMRNAAGDGFLYLTVSDDDSGEPFLATSTNPQDCY